MNIRNVNILLVEDDEVEVKHFKRSMKRYALPNSLFVARDGIEAMALLRGDSDGGLSRVPRPCLVLLDLNLPRMNGLEFLREIRADALLRTTTIIVITASDDEHDRAAAYDLNVANYIVKPVDFDLLAERILYFERSWNGFQLDKDLPAPHKT